MVKTVEIPDRMYEIIQGFINTFKDLGYDSVDEYVKECLRDAIRGDFEWDRLTQEELQKRFMKK
jgi:hypothetical protein